LDFWIVLVAEVLLARAGGRDEKHMYELENDRKGN